MIRLLHTGDIHLGRQFHSLRNKGGEYRIQLLRTFEKIVSLAQSEQVALLLIAGDLFDSNRIYGTVLGKVVSAFRNLEESGIRVCILPGTHDAFTEESIYRAARFPRNVTVFTPEYTRQTYEDLDLTVYGMVGDANTPGKSPLQGLSLDPKSRFQIGMAHCSLKRHGIDGETVMLDEAEIANSGLSYLALGHWHSFEEVGRGNTIACYCGSPEPIDRDQKGAGNVVMVTLHDNNQVEINPVRVGTRKSETMVVDLGPLDSADSVMDLIEARADPNLILEIVLTGLRSATYDLNLQEIESSLGSHFFNLRVRDESHPKLEEIISQNFSERTVAGRFLKLAEGRIARASTPEQRSLYEEALQLGFALLQGRSQVIE